jgi:hypothetical protein
VCIAAAAPLAGASPSVASVGLGQLAPATTPLNHCGPGGFDALQPSVVSGNGYVAPGAGTITSWSTFAVASGVSPQQMVVKVFRKVADPRTYQVVGHDGPRDLVFGLNGFPASIPVKAGDVLGLYSPTMADTACFPAPGESFLTSPGNLPDGEFAAFNSTMGGAIGNSRLNISAVFVPSNAFTLGNTTRNKKKGTATLTVDVPNPGELTVSGNGVKAASAGRAETSKEVGAGPAQLLIKAKGKKRKKLNETGKVKLNVAITYTPSNGDPATQSVKVKLRKK